MSSTSEPGTEATSRTVIVGGGIGGLLLAYRLARRGMPVAVIEKNEQFGGFNGRSPSGMPLVCYSALGFEPDGSLARLMNDNDAWRKEIPARKLNCDLVVLPEARFCLPGSLEEFEHYLCDTFPHEAKALETFCLDVKTVYAAIVTASASQSMGERARAWTAVSKLAEVNFRDDLKQRFADPILQTLLSVRAFSTRNSTLTMFVYLGKILIDGLYGMPSSGALLTDALVSALRSSPHCNLYESRRAEEILFDTEKKATAVKLHTGEVISGQVVLGIDPRHVCADLITHPEIKTNLQESLRTLSGSLSAINIVFKLSAGIGASLEQYRQCARVFYSEAIDPFEVLARREAGELTLENCKINFNFDDKGIATHVYVEFDCASDALPFAAMAGSEEENLASVIDLARQRLATLVPHLDDGIEHIDVITPHTFAKMTNSLGGAASGFTDQLAGTQALMRCLQQFGLLQVGQWSHHGAGLPQLERSALDVYATLRRQRLPGETTRRNALAKPN